MQTGKAPAKPVRQPSVHDIVSRIKKGEFAGADYVLFGTVSSMEFRSEVSPIQGSTSASSLFSLNLISDFSLINAKTYEITAAFSAQGQGQEVKLLSHRGDVVAPNRGQVIRATSRTLADSVYAQLVEQLGPNGRPPIAGAGSEQAAPASAGQAPTVPAAQPPTLVFK
jgi:curli biogenesis system outer membrane secretion channel CsgG